MRQIAGLERCFKDICYTVPLRSFKRPCGDKTWRLHFCQGIPNQGLILVRCDFIPFTDKGFRQWQKPSGIFQQEQAEFV